MIEFNSPEGNALRAMEVSGDALLSLWFTALKEGHDEWAAWAAEKADAPGDADDRVLALRFLDAAGKGEAKQSRQLWAILKSCQNKNNKSRIVQAALELGQSVLG
jgi:hypothetical protein